MASFNRSSLYARNRDIVVLPGVQSACDTTHADELDYEKYPPSIQTGH